MGAAAAPGEAERYVDTSARRVLRFLGRRGTFRGKEIAVRQIFGFLVALGVSSRAFGALPAALPHILIKHGDVQTKVDGEWKSTIATENLIPPHYRLAPVFASDLATGPSVDWD